MASKEDTERDIAKLDRMRAEVLALTDLNQSAISKTASKGVITAQDRAIARHTGLTEEQLQQAADLRAKKFGI